MQKSSPFSINHFPLTGHESEILQTCTGGHDRDRCASVEHFGRTIIALDSQGGDVVVGHWANDAVRVDLATD
jgi:hypothetical protein